MVLYQDLDDKYKNSGIMRIVEKDKFPKGKSITQLNIDINYI